jgi:MoxR-like ATPase
LSEKLRIPAEEKYAVEIAALAADAGQKPPGWRMTPKAVVTYLMGGTAHDGTAITPKYIGNRRIMETAVSSLITGKALLLLGVPGTAKSWVSEHLSAAISGNSTRIVQGTAGTDENKMTYGWNYAELIAKGPSRTALVTTPVMRAMEEGTICRIEELTRMGSDVQDTLISVLSEKAIPIPEINENAYATRGFNIIATANNRDKGVNDLSSALMRRFNVVTLPLPSGIDDEVSIIVRRVGEMAAGLEQIVPKNVADEVRRVVTIFRELRSGHTEDGRAQLKSPSSGLSTAEAIDVMMSGISQGTHFNNGVLDAESLSGAMLGAIIKDPVQDRGVLDEYLHTVVKKRPGYADHFAALSGRG